MLQMFFKISKAQGKFLKFWQNYFTKKKVLQFDLQHSWHWHFIFSDDFFISFDIFDIKRFGQQTVH